MISRSRRNSIRNHAKDLIEEYEDVAYGEKKLSKVSERKKSYTVKVGDNNNTVENIQQKLYNLGYTSQLVTGYYGDITFNNVAYFQIVNGLTVTGWVDSDTYNKLFAVKETTLLETENTIPYAYTTNLYEGMEVRKGWLKLKIKGNEYSDQITLHMYSYTWNNNGFSERKRIDGNSDTLEFDCTDVGNYTLIIESRNNSTGEIFECDINFTVVDSTNTIDMFAYFMLGIWDGVVETGEGIVNVVSHPLNSAKSLVSGSVFVVKALVSDGEEREALYNIWTSSGMQMLADLEDDEAKDIARKLGKFTCEIALIVAAEKGITKAVDALKESAKSGKLSKVSNAFVKTGQKADDFVDDLVKVNFKNEFYKTLDEGLNFTATALSKFKNQSRFVSIQMMIDTIKTGICTPDPQGIKNLMMYYKRVIINGKDYNLEVLYDISTNTVNHFKYTEKAIGPLAAISN